MDSRYIVSNYRHNQVLSSGEWWQEQLHGRISVSFRSKNLLLNLINEFASAFFRFALFCKKLVDHLLIFVRCNKYRNHWINTWFLLLRKYFVRRQNDALFFSPHSAAAIVSYLSGIGVHVHCTVNTTCLFMCCVRFAWHMLQKNRIKAYTGRIIEQSNISLWLKQFFHGTFYIPFFNLFHLSDKNAIRNLRKWSDPLIIITFIISFHSFLFSFSSLSVLSSIRFSSRVQMLIPVAA